MTATLSWTTSIKDAATKGTRCCIDCAPSPPLNATSYTSLHQLLAIPPRLKMINRLFVGIKRHPSTLPISAFVAYSVIWTVVASTSRLLSISAIKPRSFLTFAVMVAASLAWGVYRTLPKRSISARIKSPDIAITVCFGDIFDTDGLRVIPVNEYFDSELGDHVSPHSLHGKLIERRFNGHSALFDSLVDEDLAAVTRQRIARTSGREQRYPIGTTARIDVGRDRYFLLALSTTDTETLKASCDVPQLWQALTALWDTVRNRAGGAPVAAPLIGGGLSGVGLPPAQLAQLLVLSLVSAGKTDHIASPITLVLPTDRADEIDLKSLIDYWR